MSIIIIIASQKRKYVDLLGRAGQFHHDREISAFR